MGQDMLKGRRTEIDFINGVIAGKGAEVGVPAPDPCEADRRGQGGRARQKGRGAGKSIRDMSAPRPGEEFFAPFIDQLVGPRKARQLPDDGIRSAAPCERESGMRRCAQGSGSARRFGYQVIVSLPSRIS